MRRRLVPVVLVVSLAGNLFLGGIFLGSQLRDAREGEAQPPPRESRFDRVSERLDPQEAEALRVLLRARSEAAEPRFETLRTLRRELEAVMAQPRYDPDAARAALGRVRAEETALRGEVDEALLQFAAGLDAEERVALTPLLRKGRRLRSPEAGAPEPSRP